MEGEIGDDEYEGLTPRMVRAIFSSILDDDSPENQNFSYSVQCSYVEIYNEKIKDLLNPAQS